MSGASPALEGKFQDPAVTLTGEKRAHVRLEGLRTLWFNTGTLCNIACAGCYIESDPRNDRLAYLTREEVRGFLDEARTAHPELAEIGFTGGEPFMNPDIAAMLSDSLDAGYHVLVLTNAMAPMQRPGVKDALLGLRARHTQRLTIRVSLDHPARERHDALRGAGSWDKTCAGLRWLAEAGFAVAVAGRTCWDESIGDLRAQYAALFRHLGMAVDARDPAALVLFPEMGRRPDVPEITEHCWGILGKAPSDVMCASSRMVVRRRDAARPAVLACTLLAYDPRFELGATLREAGGAVPLNHRFCAEFCVLGGASCSPASHQAGSN